MSTNYHVPIPSSPRQPANAATLNTPLGALDAALTAEAATRAAAIDTLDASVTMVDNEVEAARGGSASLAARLNAINLAGGGVTLTTLSADVGGGDAIISVVSTTGFGDSYPITIEFDDGTLWSANIVNVLNPTTLSLDVAVPGSGVIASSGNIVATTIEEVRQARGFFNALPGRVADLELAKGYASLADAYAINGRRAGENADAKGWLKEAWKETGFFNSRWYNNEGPVLANPSDAVAADIVILDVGGGTYRCWFHGPVGSPSYIWSATSTDGITWSTPVEVTGIVGFTVTVVFLGSTYHMWYAQTPGAAHIYYATSADGLAWTAQNSGNAVMTDTEPFEKEGNLQVRNPWCEWDSVNERWNMWYGCSGVVSAGASNGEPKSTAFATSADGITWTKHGLVATASGIVGDWREKGCLMNPQWDGERYVGYGIGYDDDTARIGILISPDGKNFTEIDGNPIIQPSDLSGFWAETYTQEQTYRPFAITIGGEDRIYYNAGIYGTERIGYSRRVPMSPEKWQVKQYVKGGIVTVEDNGLQIVGSGVSDNSWCYVQGVNRKIEVGEIVWVRVRVTNAGTATGDGSPFRAGISNLVPASTLKPNADQFEYFIYYLNRATPDWRGQKRVNHTFGTEDVFSTDVISTSEDYFVYIRRAYDGAVMKVFDHTLTQVGTTVTFSGDTASEAQDFYVKLGMRFDGTVIYKSVTNRIE